MGVKRDSLRTLLFQLFGLGAGILTNVIVGRTLGPSGKGLLSYLGYALFVTISIGGLGLQSAAIQQFGKRSFPAESVAAAQLVLGAIAGLLAGALATTVLLAFPTRIAIAPVLAVAFSAVILTSLLQNNLIGVMIGANRVRAANRIQALVPLLWLAAAFVLLAWLRRNATVGALAWMAAQVCSGVAAVIWVLRTLRPRFRALGPCLRASLAFGGEAYLSNLLWALLLRSDGLILGSIRGASDVGIYSIAVLLAELLWYVPRSLTFALGQRVAAASAEEAVQLVQRAARTALWTVIVGGIVLSLSARFLVRILLGAAFATFYRPFLLLLPGIISGSVAAPLALFLTQNRSRPRINAWISGVGLAVNVGLNILWIPRYGASAAAATSSIGYSLVAALLIWKLHEERGFSWGGLILLRRSDVDGAVAMIRPRLFPAREGNG